MMGFAELARRAEKLVADNSPAILTTIGITGTLTTAYLTGKASFKAAEIIENEKLSRSIRKVDPPLETKDKVELTWKLYIPAMGSAVFTIACIIGANRIGTRRAAAVAAAYSLSERAFSEYKDKVIEKMGEKKEQELRDELAQDRVDRTPVSNREVIIIGSGDVLCFDEFTSRYFTSDVQTLRRAQNDTNHKVLNCYYASLTDFYNLIGLPPTSQSDEVGWNSDKLLDLNISTTLSDDDRPCLSIGFAVAPIRDYYRVS